MTTTAERVAELYRLSRDQQSKFTYFLLAGVAAAIAFAVQITAGEVFRWQHYILGFAVLAWLLSFVAGVKYLETAMAVTDANHIWLQFRQDLVAGRLPQTAEVMELHEQIEGRVRGLSENSGGWGNWQVRLFYLGAVAFIGWHVLSMANNPIAT